jgi:hypothetical protein
MRASTDRSSHFQTPQAGDAPAVFALAVWSGCVLTAAVLIARRAEGAFTAATGPALPCSAATAAVFLSLLANGMWNRSRPSSGGVRRPVLAALATIVPPLTIGLALTTSASAFIAVYLASLGIAASLGILAMNSFDTQFLLDPPSQGCEPVVHSEPFVQEFEREIEEEETPDEDVPPDEDTADEERGSFLQQTTRRQTPEGREIVEGTVRISFEPGETLAVAHVPFLPALTGAPQTECHIVSSFSGRVRVAAAQPYGLRLEARRTGDASKSEWVEIAFSSHSSASPAEAA